LRLFAPDLSDNRIERRREQEAESRAVLFFGMTVSPPAHLRSFSSFSPRFELRRFGNEFLREHAHLFGIEGQWVR
jgi:hypothetical protein